MIEAEYPANKMKLLSRTITNNSLLDFNISTRELDQKHRKIMQKMGASLKKGLDLTMMAESSRTLSRKQQEKCQAIEEMKQSIARDFRSRLEEYIHFQKEAKTDTNNRFSAEDIQKLLNQDV